MRVSFTNFRWAILLIAVFRGLALRHESTKSHDEMNSTQLEDRIIEIRQVVLQQLDYEQSWRLDWNTLCNSYPNEQVSYKVLDFFIGVEFYQKVVALLFITILLLTSLFAIVHKLLQSTLQVYNSFDASQQFILTFHVIMCTVLGVQVFTHIWLMILFFYSDPIHVLVEHSWFILSMPVSHVILYAVEMIVRAVIRVQPAILIHHCMFMSYLLLLSLKPSIFILQNGFIIDWMVVFEFLLYAGNVCYKFCDEQGRRVVQNVIISGLVLYVLSRIVQTMMLMQSFVCTDAPKNYVYWILVVFAVLFSFVQAYTYIPYMYMYKNAGKVQGTPSNDVSDKGNDSCDGDP